MIIFFLNAFKTMLYFQNLEKKSTAIKFYNNHSFSSQKEYLMFKKDIE